MFCSARLRQTGVNRLPEKRERVDCERLTVARFRETELHRLHSSLKRDRRELTALVFCHKSVTPYSTPPPCAGALRRAPSFSRSMEERPASLACLKGGNPGEFIACADYLTRLSPARLTCLRCAWLVTATRPCLDSATISVKEFASQRASFVARGKRSLRVGLETQRTALLSVETVVLGRGLILLRARSKLSAAPEEVPTTCF